MQHQDQYYNAKIFLKHYNSAIKTLEECAKQDMLIKNYQLATKNLVHAVAQNYIKINGDEVVKTKNYKGSKPYHMAEFTNGLFTKYMPSLKRVESYGQLIKDLSLGLQVMRKQANEQN